jgi:predicted RND superfamily exporter protein
MNADLDGKFVFMNNQAIYRKSAVSGSIMGIRVAAFVILFSTWSLLTSTIATMSIFCVTISVVGLTTMMGWTLGTIQSILITILADFSVDYVLHLEHAYCKSAGTRKERIVSAFSEVGSPVLRHTLVLKTNPVL